MYLLNNFDIRHNNRTGKSKKDFITNMAEDDLEKWYDKTYNSVLSVIIQKEQKEIDKEVADFKKTNKD
jgi:hypothetical protein